MPGRVNSPGAVQTEGCTDLERGELSESCRSVRIGASSTVPERGRPPQTPGPNLDQAVGRRRVGPPSLPPPALSHALFLLHLA